MSALTGAIYLTGRLAADPVFSENQKGKPIAKLLLEAELVREISRGELRSETHLLPITLFSWVADQTRTLRSGSSVTVAARFSGNQFEKSPGEIRYGIQLVAETLLFAPPKKEPNARS
jgi:single-stranded DNA-binding protein